MFLNFRMITNRTPIRRQSPFSSLMNSSKQYTVAGCDEQPRKTVSTWKHKYSKWLTAGLKIQSLKIHDNKINNARNSSQKIIGDHTIAQNGQMMDSPEKVENDERPIVLNGEHIGPWTLDKMCLFVIFKCRNCHLIYLVDIYIQPRLAVLKNSTCSVASNPYEKWQATENYKPLGSNILLIIKVAWLYTFRNWLTSSLTLAALCTMVQFQRGYTMYGGYC